MQIDPSLPLSNSKTLFQTSNRCTSMLATDDSVKEVSPSGASPLTVSRRVLFLLGGMVVAAAEHLDLVVAATYFSWPKPVV